MIEIITKKNEVGEYANDITREIDKYLKRPNRIWRTYIYDHQISKNSWPIRYPGATRGSIIVDDNDIITNIIIDPQNCYKMQVVEVVKKFIGSKLVIVKEE